MFIKKFLFINLISLFLCTFCFGLDWQKVCEIVEKNNPELKAAQKKVVQTEWQKQKALSVFFPQILASASVSESQSGGDQNFKNYSYGLSLSQNLFSGLENYYNLRSSEINLEYQKESLKLTKASVLFEARCAFVDLLMIQEEIKLLEKIYTQKKENSKLVALRYEGGRESKGNLMTTKADETQALLELSNAKRRLNLVLLKLNQLTGEKIESAEEVIQLKDIENEQLDLLVKNSPYYICAQKQLELAEISAKASYSDYFPNVFLSGNYSKKGTNWPPDTLSKTWSLNFSIPIFTAGKRVAETAEAVSALDYARQNFIKSINELRYSVYEAYKNYCDALDAVQIAEVFLESSKQRAIEIEVKYLNGLASYDEWYRLENNYVEAQKNLLAQKRKALLAEANWYKSFGGWKK